MLRIGSLRSPDVLIRHGVQNRRTEMRAAAQLLESIDSGVQLAKWVVVEVDEAPEWVGIRQDAYRSQRARVALEGTSLRLGDHVLAASQGSGETFVIGLLQRAVPSEPQPRYLDLRGGTRVVASGAPEGDVLRVEARDGRVLFEYDERSGRARAHVPDGDVDIVAPHGSIALRASSSIRLDAPRVSVAAEVEVDLSVGDPGAPSSSSFRLDPVCSRWTASHVQMTARRARFALGDAELAGRTATARLGRARIVVGRLETIAETIVERARSAYRTVRELTQLQAGRVRTLVDASYHLTANRTVIKAKQDVKIDGEQIHLG